MFLLIVVFMVIVIIAMIINTIVIINYLVLIVKSNHDGHHQCEYCPSTTITELFIHHPSDLKESSEKNPCYGSRLVALDPNRLEQFPE